MITMVLNMNLNDNARTTLKNSEIKSQVENQSRKRKAFFPNRRLACDALENSHILSCESG